MTGKSSLLLVAMGDRHLPKAVVAVESREKLRGSEAIQTVVHTWQRVCIFDRGRVKTVVVYAGAHRAILLRSEDNGCSPF